jgi:hypothetical protein
MIRHTDRDFDPEDIIRDHLVTPTSVTTDGLRGNFDSLRVALEHLQSHGIENTILAIQAPGDELQFADEGLEALIKGFARWLYNAGLTSP